MSEDYTWDETVTEHGYAVQNAGLRRDNATLAQRVMELERENAELRARLEAVPMDVLREDYHKRFGTRELRWWPKWALPIGRWLFPDVQPADDPDAPLTLAAIDEDGDL